MSFSSLLRQQEHRRYRKEPGNAEQMATDALLRQ
jgi:hypothetical protein